jgi:hypothetical protein
MLFAILAANGLSLDLEKCVFAVSELDFLGHCISAAGITPFRDTVQVILDFPKPTDCKALQRFLDMMNFYRRFLPGIASSICPFKAALVAAVPLAHPLLGAILALATDASDTHVGAVLQQQVGQHWQPLEFFSKKLSKTEVNYSTFDRELLPVMSGIKHFRS